MMHEEVGPLAAAGQAVTDVMTESQEIYKDIFLNDFGQVQTDRQTLKK